MRAVGVLVAGVVAGLLVGGCAGSNERVEGEGAMADDLAATMEVKVGSDSVRLLLHVTNTGSEAVEFTFPSSQRYDFVVADAGGERVWRWSDGMSFLQAVSSGTLAPGESWDMEAVWEPGGRTGTFVATGRLTAGDRALEQRATFELR
jgi:hypothetical protein